ncbi:MAG TPA: septal ring lytic transglycosylase RlpA family protein [Crinalium sp.]
MNFIGLVWIASCVGSLFSPQSLLKTSDYIRVFAARTLSVFGDTATAAPAPDHAAAPLPARPSTQRIHIASSSPALGWESSRTQIPLIQSFLQPFSWLNPTDSILFRPSSARYAMGEPRTHFRFGPPVASPSEPLQSQQKRATQTSSSRIAKLFSSLSRWSKSVGRQLRTMTTNVVVLQTSQIDQQDIPIEKTQPNGLGLEQCIPASKRTVSNAVSRRKTGFQIWVKGHAIAELPTKAQADAVAQRIQQVLKRPKFDPRSLAPAIVDDRPAGKAGGELLFSIDEDLETALGRNGSLIAIDWINNLRIALSTPVLTLDQAQIKMYGLQQTGETMEGTASWYGPYFHGRLTAAGELFDQNELTAAHPSLPFNTYLKVTNLRNGDAVIVRINDRGPYVGSRSLDLSREAARCLGSENTGVVPYEAVIMEPSEDIVAAEQLDDSNQGRVTQLAQRP